MTAAVESALIAVTNLITDQIRVDSIRNAAVQQKDNIRTISCALETENLTLGNNLQTNINGINITFMIIAEQLAKRSSPRHPNPDLFVELMQLQQMRNKHLAFANALSDSTTSAPVTPTPSCSSAAQVSAPSGWPNHPAAPMAKTLDALVTTNDAIASESPGDISSLASWFYTQAQSAIAIYNTLNGSSTSK
jgi:hypothetical protein